jgi:LacI family transcriptional regulator
MKDIAQRAGLSRTAVSMALRGEGRISPSVAKRVRELARELNYRPTVAAQMLRGKRKGQIGLLLDRVALGRKWSVMGFQNPFIEAFVELCDREQQRYYIEYMTVDDNDEGLAIPRQFAGQMVDATVIVGHVAVKLQQRLSSEDFAQCVVVDEPVGRCVLSADDQGVFKAARYLAALGHRRIAFASGTTRYWSHRSAREGFVQAIKEVGIDPGQSKGGLVEFDDVASADSAVDYLIWARELLAEKNRPTAVICTSSRIARVLLYVAASMGLSVPGELSVISHGTAGAFESEYPRVSAIERDYERMMSLALKQIQALLVGDEAGPQRQFVDTKMVLRDTTGPA